YQFISYIEVLDEKANKWQNYAICHAYHNAVGRPTVLLQKFSSKSDQVKNHLKKCKHFINAQGGKEAVLKILGIGLKEIEKQDTRSYTDNTSSNKLHDSNDESENKTPSNNEVQMSEENLNKESKKLEDEINVN
ncbi:18836_t:CDS:2, partial [Racocetra fulgida]